MFLPGSARLPSGVVDLGEQRALRVADETSVTAACHAKLLGEPLAHMGGVLVGAALLLAAAIRQPFSYDEITQITPYGSNRLVAIVSATRQPPLDPLLGALCQHLFGQGQLQQRLVPVMAGIGILVVTSALMRRLGLGWAGVWAVWVLATAPLAVRYGAYSRPYALPALWMMLFVLASHHWLADRRRGWLWVAAATAVAMPLTRVPESTVFLAVTCLSLGVATRSGSLRWRDARPLIIAAGSSLLLVATPLFLLLSAQTQGSFFDPRPAGIVHRAWPGLEEIASSVVPLLGRSFPWWPLTLAVVIVALGLPSLRRRLFGSWFWWPLLAAPVGFLVAYHLLNPFEFSALPYRARAAYFFVPPFVLVTAAAACAVRTTPRRGRVLRVSVAALLAAALISQLPATADVLTKDAAPDFARASALLRDQVPRDAIVIYDRPTPAGQSRQPFLGQPRYMGSRPRVLDDRDLAGLLDRPTRLTDKPVYVLINGQCARPGRCELSRSPWVHPVPGWRLAATAERFSLYRPTGGSSRTDLVSALQAFGQALGPQLGYVETLWAAALLDREGRHAEARTLVEDLRSRLSPLDRRRADEYAVQVNLPEKL
jgi:hypothetical protein